MNAHAVRMHHLPPTNGAYLRSGFDRSLSFWVLGGRDRMMGTILRFLFLLYSVLAIPIRADQVFTNAPRPDFWDTDGSINAILATNGVVYVGGSFSYVSPKGHRAGAIDIYTGSLDSQFPSMAGGTISALAEDGSGGWFIGGSFNQVAGLPRTNLVHVLSDDSIDPAFHPNVDAPVRALALDGDTLFVGGEFSTMDGQPRTRLAAIDVRNQALAPWSPQANGAVSNIVVSGATIYAGGFFTTMGGQPRNNIAALDRTTGLATAWNPNANGVVQTMALLEDRLYVGGFFTTIGGMGRYGLAALDIHQNTLNATDWNPDPDGKVTVLRVTCDAVYVGGYFTEIGGIARHRAAAIDVHSGHVLPWNPNLDLTYSANRPSSVQAIELSGQRVYLGGQFTISGPQPRRDLVAVDATTGSPLAWNPNINGGIGALAVGGRNVVAGFVNTPGGRDRQNLAAFDSLSGKATDWNPSASGPVLALANVGDTIFAGGSFTNVAGLTRHRLAAIDAVSGNVIADWNPDVDGSVFSLASDGTTLFLGGAFNTVSGQSRLRLAAVDGATGQPLPAWSPQVLNGSVRALGIAGNTLYVGGSFTAIGGSNRQHIAALNIANGQVLNWNPNASNNVSALAISDSAIYAGGSFTGIGGKARNFVAALDPISGVATDWDPDADAEVAALAVSGNTIYLGGNFQAVAGEMRLGCVAVDASGALLDWNPGVSFENQVSALAVSEQAIHVAGPGALQFESSASSHALGVFPLAGAPVIVVAPHDQDVAVGADAAFTVDVEGQGPFSYQWRFNGANLIGQTSATLLRNAAQVDQSGAYEVIVTNALGAITAEATLTVLSPVVITAQPINQTASAGSTITLSVAANANPPPIYQWRLNGANIPGAVFPTLTLSNVTAASGGSYYVAIANRLGAVNSDIAEIVISSPALPFADDLSNRGTISGISGTGSGNNVAATSENNEPNHAGKTGGKSVWLTWTAPASGIATFSTRGSGFDTLLAIYTNAAALGTVASDDDRGGFFTSRATFNAVAGVEYLIAVDGLAGGSGNIVLSWDLDATVADFPRIVAEPLSQSLAAGNAATFEVVASSQTPMTFQWFFACQPIAGATNSLLVISNVQTRNVGFYRVVVMNSSTRVAESLPAALEIGPNATALSFDKLEEIVGSEPGKAFLTPSAFASGGGAILVSMGSIVSQMFDTTGYQSGLHETNHCGVIGGASAWLKFQPTQNGTVLVDTIGSSFDTILAIYRDTNILVLQTNLSAAHVQCDDNGAPDHVRSLLTFTGTAGTYYLAVVDGVNGASGSAVVHWQLGSAPTIISTTSNITQQAGGVVTLSAGVTSTVSSVKYQWRFNGTNLIGQTGATLTLSNLTSAQRGNYSVVVSNFAGVVTNLCATLAIDVPLHLENMGWISNGQFACEIKGNPGQLFALQASTNLTSWTTLLADQLITDAWTFSDTNAHLFKERFYRVIPSIVLEPSLISANGTSQLRINSKSIQSCVLETSTNFIDWLPLYTNSAANAPLQYTQDQPTNSSHHFFRARLWP